MLLRYRKTLTFESDFTIRTKILLFLHLIFYLGLISLSSVAIENQIAIAADNEQTRCSNNQRTNTTINGCQASRIVLNYVLWKGGNTNTSKSNRRLQSIR